MEERDVVTCFLRNRGEVLLLRRSDEVGSYPGAWGGVAGHAEGDPDAAAREEIREETGLGDAVTLVRAGEPFAVEDDELGVRWIVHPYLFDCASRDVEVDPETAEHEWTSPTEIPRRETVPDLWTSYERVAPTVETVREDREHGSAYISVRALEVLRDSAGVLAAGGADGWSDLADLARELRDAREGMAVVANRVNRAMHEAAGDGRTAAAIEAAAVEGIERALDADARAAATAASLDPVADGRVVTLSRSGTVLDALREAEPRVVVAESRPALEGVGVAESLAGAGVEVTLCTDAALAHLLATRECDAALVGADAVLPDGSVVNKTGTRALALAAAREGVPLYAVAARDKVSPDPEPHLEAGDPAAVYDGSAAIDVANPTFDRTPADLVAGIATEAGVLDSAGVGSVAADHRKLAAWEG